MNLVNDKAVIKQQTEAELPYKAELGYFIRIVKKKQN